MNPYPKLKEKNMGKAKSDAALMAKLQKLPIIGKPPADENEEKYLREVCWFEFFNLKEAKVSVRFPYGNSKNQHNFTLFPGGKYHLPRFIARHIESKGEPQWDWRPDGTGSMIKEYIGDEPRFQMRQVFGE